MNKRKLIWIGSTISLVGGILVFMGNGCSGEFVPKNLSDTTARAPSSSNEATSDDDYIPGAKTVSLAYANQILEHLTSCSGVQTPSDSTLLVYENKRGAISVYGSANTVTSPMMMAVTSVAGEVCNDLINQEIAAQRIFKNINLNANSMPNQADLKDAISRLAISCWQRQDTDAERATLLQAVDTIAVDANQTRATYRSALMVCTSMLSSLDALTN